MGRNTSTAIRTDTNGSTPEKRERERNHGNREGQQQHDRHQQPEAHQCLEEVRHEQQDRDSGQRGILKPAQVISVFQDSLDTRAAVTATQASYKSALADRVNAEVKRQATDDALKDGYSTGSAPTAPKPTSLGTRHGRAPCCRRGASDRRLAESRHAPGARHDGQEGEAQNQGDAGRPHRAGGPGERGGARGLAPVTAAPAVKPVVSVPVAAPVAAAPAAAPVATRW